jgi:hypothetical protein
MRLLIAALAILLTAVSLAPPAHADGEQYGPPQGMTRAQIAQLLSEQNRKFAKRIEASAPMAKQIGDNLNNDGSEAFMRNAPAPIRRNAFGRVIDNRATQQKIYNPNDDSIMPQNPFGHRTFVHRMVQRPGTGTASGSFNN